MNKWWFNIVLGLIFLVLLIPTMFQKTLSADLPEADKLPVPVSNTIVLVRPYVDLDTAMYDHRSGTVVLMPLETYLIGVVAGEMPAGFHPEALKAQAVAARTLAVFKMRSLGGRGCSQHPDADVCASFAHCQEWISKAAMRKNWGDRFEENYEKIKAAVALTRGEIIKYQGKPIEVLYHSTSNGKTEDSGEVFSVSLPYYQVVESFGEENFSKFHNRVTVTNQQFIDTFKKRYPSAQLSQGNLAGQIRINSYTESGRIQRITVGGITLRGAEFRRIFDLYSADITFSFDKDSVTMDTRGFGHGVGMSQAGANAMAQRGYRYDEILRHYYQGTEIGSLR